MGQVEVPCPVCASSERRVVFPATTSRDEVTPFDLACSTAIMATYDTVVRCNSCGLMYTSPRPSNADILSRYAEVADRVFLEERRGREMTYRRLLREIGGLTGGRKGRMLDIGCAMGFFPHVARKAGWQVEGLEPSRWAADYARNTLGLAVRQGSISEAELEPESYDVITMWDVIEHLVDPLGDLRKLAAALKPGGLFAFSTHSIESLVARLLGPRYPFLMAMHVTHFSTRTTALLCGKAGMRQFRVTPHVRYTRIGYVIGKIGQVAPRIAAAMRAATRGVGVHDWYIPVIGLGIFNGYAVKEKLSQ